MTDNLKCPTCNTELPNNLINAHFASIGGKMSAEKLTPEQRSERAKKAVNARRLKVKKIV